ncbi:flagellar biosynthetic protein FliO [Rhizosaccharibacter radicis]|uniref:Flagellar biosynthetic protein FliO n=1 Tax=Rhizosaccharibacter radicis TaxID=2782605 RepID=A0ABT1VZB4_9PROT|nr:flagellar biosynthetic protein FliO [Acetobacteraceae bacterium KSS12]
MTLSDILTSLGALALVLGLLGLIRYGARFRDRSVRSSASSALRVEGTLPLDARRRVHMITCDGRRLLLLTGGSNDVAIGWLDRADTARDGEAVR